ncbi:MAG: 1-(5-phosphoribosyl)-5-[(5-phosphoribosylamino)methylideneamino]imidazole-4-carboxamide isomerase [Chloracidobacterium sp.]|nr:1-(5-phosphoribosyl)-5-[(5-phosphoribosylamino)methylideneamino]imidazole-4-carboxamide isomerase [Chloracidobacterium sp.]MDW8216545.1 1-(5-phosphoribosyl)-5-[(5-phosphoribosylamino)methylideneamino]imidazole-4-carboxamide isomerase [Acidobacteriota bacterium]
MFEVIPAIDLRQGKCVRLQQGDKDSATVYAADPLAVAQRWRDEGARRLHVVNLDGAFDDDDTDNLQATARIVRGVDIPIQFGGGIRSFATAARLFELGVHRIVLGTVAVEQPALVAELITRFGAEAIVVGVDAKQGRVATHGWQVAGECTPLELAQRVQALGVTRIVYTDITRDGMLVGGNVAATAELARATGLRVIASGGVATLADLQALAATGVVEGCIVGKALYEGRFSLRAALQRLFG